MHYNICMREKRSEFELSYFGIVFHGKVCYVFALGIIGYIFEYLQTDYRVKI